MEQIKFGRGKWMTSLVTKKKTGGILKTVCIETFFGRRRGKHMTEDNKEWCKACDGTGILGFQLETCWFCCGTGLISKRNEVKKPNRKIH